MITDTKFDIDTIFYVPKSIKKYITSSIIVDDKEYTNETVVFEPYVRTKKIVGIEGFCNSNNEINITYRVINLHDDSSIDTFKYYHSEDSIQSSIEYTHDSALAFATDAANKGLILY